MDAGGIDLTSQFTTHIPIPIETRFKSRVNPERRKKTPALQNPCVFSPLFLFSHTHTHTLTKPTKKKKGAFFAIVPHLRGVDPRSLGNPNYFTQQKPILLPFSSTSLFTDQQVSLSLSLIRCLILI